MTGISETSSALNKAMEVLAPSLGGCKEIGSSYNHTHDLGEQVIENLQLTIKGLAEYLSHVAKIGTATDKIVDTHVKARDILVSADLARDNDDGRVAQDLQDLADQANEFRSYMVDPTLQALGSEHGILHVLEGIVPIVRRSVTEFEEEWQIPEQFAIGITSAIKDCQTMRDNL